MGGNGPFRAVVLSGTAVGTIVDFNCEVFGILQNPPTATSSKHGDVLRVYISSIDKSARTCQVSTKKPQTQSKNPERSNSVLKVSSLDLTGGKGYIGHVVKLIDNGAIVDFNC